MYISHFTKSASYFEINPRSQLLLVCSCFVSIKMARLTSNEEKCGFLNESLITFLEPHLKFYDIIPWNVKRYTFISWDTSEFDGKRLVLHVRSIIEK